MDKQAAPGPLAGIRILETGHGYAVPYAARLLADMGAEVIKLEAPNYPYNLRLAGPYPEGVMDGDYWNRAGFLQELNRNKLGLTLDLGQAKGRDLLREILRHCDVFAENFAPRVLVNLGFGYEDVRKIRPDIIMISSTGYGHSGPYKHYAAWGDSLEPMSGLSVLSGTRERPVGAGMPFTDVPAAYTGAFAVLAALRHRRRTGEGQWIDLAQYEVGIGLIPQAVMEFALNGRETPRAANHHRLMAPHNAYRCLGHDRWIALACPDDETWGRLAQLAGRPAWATDGRFAGAFARKQHEAEIDAALDAWAAGLEDTEAFRLLREARVPSSPVMSARGQLFDPHLAAREAFVRIEHSGSLASLGARYYPANPWHFSATPPAVRRQAPTLGQHSAQVLGELAGMAPDEIAAIEADGVTGTEYRKGQFKHDTAGGPKAADAAGQLGDGLWRDADYRQRLGLDGRRA